MEDERKSLNREVVKRYEGNPILTIDDMPVYCNSVFNPGAIKFSDRYLLFLRVEDNDRISHFRVATSKDGVHFEVWKDPANIPGGPGYDLYETNRYDGRISLLDGWYYIMFCSEADFGCRLGLIRSKDFVHYERLPFASETEQRNGVLFPEKIDGLYARLDRPLNQYGGGDMWISYSPDLTFWGKSSLIMRTRWHCWDEEKLGPAAVPIKTKEGWLCIYHGVRHNASTRIYKLGVCLLDLKDPSRVIARSRYSILGPKEIYERTGDVPNAVFCNGAIVEDDGEVKIYYGAADQVVCLATTTVKELIWACYEG
jgi:predicted GH43/DUF377 family glycosyl hydrolase